MIHYQSVSSKPSSPKTKLKENGLNLAKYQLCLRKFMRKSRTLSITQAAMIAALYVVLNLVSSLLGLSSGNIQIRLSESLTILPFFTPTAIPGLTIGCFLGNLLTGCPLIDVIFGSLATALGAIGSRLLRKNKVLILLPPIASNTLIVPFILKYGYGLNLPLPFMMLTVGIGEIISCGILGSILLSSLKKNKRLFK